jgi:hypothetical protein
MPGSPLVLTRLSIILSSSLAQDSHRDFWEGVGYYYLARPDTPSNSTNSTNSSTCHDPCATLQHSVTHAMALAPLGIALLFFIASALPVVLLRSRFRVHGVRSCLWVLVALWVHLFCTYAWFLHDRAQAYAWALHAASHVLAAWQPRRGVMPYPGLQRLTSLAGAWCVGLFAWQLGPPVGLAAWQRSSDALCGWRMHLTGVLGVELVEWVLGPLEGLVVI